MGVEELYENIEKHRQALVETGQLSLKGQRQRKEELVETVQQKVKDQLLKLIEADERLIDFLKKVEAGEVDPYSAAADILSNKSLLRSLLSEAEKEKE